MTASKAPGTCRHCQRVKRMHLRGLCRGCYDDPTVRPQYPAIPQSERIKAIARFGMSGGTESMPTTTYAITRTVRSPLSGWLNVVIDWFGDKRKAERFADRSCQGIDVRIERWEMESGELRQEVVAFRRATA